MSLINNVNYLNEQSDISYDINKYPDRCPICNYACEPIPALTYNRGSNKEDIFCDAISILCICPRDDCKEIFIAKYKKHNMERSSYNLVEYSPFNYNDR